MPPTLFKIYIAKALLNKIKTEFENCGLKINTEKTKYLKIDNDNEDPVNGTKDTTTHTIC